MNLIMFVILNIPRYAGALRASGEMASAQYITAGQYVYWEGLSYSVNVTYMCVCVCPYARVDVRGSFCEWVLSLDHIGPGRIELMSGLSVGTLLPEPSLQVKPQHFFI